MIANELMRIGVNGVIIDDNGIPFFSSVEITNIRYCPAVYRSYLHGNIERLVLLLQSNHTQSDDYELF
jgi:hypothetical protein